MKPLAAIALLALAAPISAQHGGGRAGSFGHAGSFGGRGPVVHGGFSGGSSASRPSNFVRPAQPFRYNSPVSSRLPRPLPQGIPGRQSFTAGNRFVPSRPSYSYQSMNAARSRSWDQGRGHDRDRDRFDRRRRDFAGWYSSLYPVWPGYPYIIDPGFYDWGEPDDSASDQGGPSPEGAAPYPDEGYGAPGPYPGPQYSEDLPPWIPPGTQAEATTPPVVSAPAPEEPLTVIFKNGRAPVKIHNYMITAKTLTDLDSHHYEQIPLDQIDIAATQRANSAAGISFEVHDASRD